MSFVENLDKGMNRNSRTSNGALSNDSTLDNCLDFFSKGAALRNNLEEANHLFGRAYAEDKLTALRILFYIRDIRQGQGERDIFKYIFEKLPLEVKKTLSKHIPEYGRWDDIIFTDPTYFHVVKHQLEDDIKSMGQDSEVSLLAKWLPSENASSTNSREQARVLAYLLELSPRQYRKTLSMLRKKINIVESKMSSREFGSIDYSAVPSKANKQYASAFNKRDGVRYNKFLESVANGEEKINSSALYTYDIYNMTKKGDNNSGVVANALWNNLPDYTNGTNSLVMADVSGSMTGMPMAMSVSLATYFAERNKGQWNGKYITFSGDPKLVSIVGDTITEKFNSVEHRFVGYNTNIMKAFRVLLETAVNTGALPEELPSSVYIISDMQFDIAESVGWEHIEEKYDKTNFDLIKEEYRKAGYKTPTIIFWNVNAQSDSPATKYDDNVTLISGASQNTFRYIVEGKSPIESMNDIVNSKRYERIII